MLNFPEGMVIEQAIRLRFMASNNELKYEALIVGLKKEKLFSVQNLVIHCDSQLVANQLTGKYATKNHIMKAYMRLVRKL